MTGRLLGIARRKRKFAPMETIDCSAVTAASGIAGDYRGRVIPGRKPSRQVTVLALADWQAALVDCGSDLPWENRRANLLVDGIALPREPGTVLAIGATLRIQVCKETFPCFRMEEAAPGLEAALTSDWRGGICTMVIADGEIAVGDEVRIEQ